jgi:hypothetical protein
MIYLYNAALGKSIMIWLGVVVAGIVGKVLSVTVQSIISGGSV